MARATASRCVLRRSPTPRAGAAIAPEIVHDVVADAGRPLEPTVRGFFERGFVRDFGAVRVHADARAAESAQHVSALAYSVGQHVVFGAGAYAPHTQTGRRLLAHELAHVAERGAAPIPAPGGLPMTAPADPAESRADAAAARALNGFPPATATLPAPSVLSRVCLPAATCAAPVSGSAEEFNVSETAAEAPARAARTKAKGAKAKAGGHGGPAKQLETFIEGQAPGLKANIHGIFVDADMSAGTGAYTLACSAFTPPIAGATKPCVFVPGKLNQEALAFNTTKNATIGGIAREEWRIQTTQALTHEIQHAIFDTAPHPTPGGVTCTRAMVDSELTELSAIMSEFPIVFRLVPAKPAKGDLNQQRLDDWFKSSITNPSESVQGALTKLRCKCDCADVDKYVADTFAFTTGSWSKAEKDAFNLELRKPVWGLGWKL